MRSGILVTLDGSSLSESVLPAAADLATSMNAAVTLLTVAEPPVATRQGTVENVQPYAFLGISSPTARPPAPEPRYVETRTQAFNRAEERLTRYLEACAEPLRRRGLDVRTAVDFGNAAERIIDYARRPEISVVAMATHGRTGLRTLIFGSVAGRVLYSGVRPLFLVRPHDHSTGWTSGVELEETPAG